MYIQYEFSDHGTTHLWTELSMYSNKYLIYSSYKMHRICNFNTIIVYACVMRTCVCVCIEFNDLTYIENTLLIFVYSI